MEMEELVENIRNDFSTVQGDMQELKKDIDSSRDDIKSVRKELEQMKSKLKEVIEYVNEKLSEVGKEQEGFDDVDGTEVGKEQEEDSGVADTIDIDEPSPDEEVEERGSLPASVARHMGRKGGAGRTNVKKASPFYKSMKR